MVTDSPQPALTLACPHCATPLALLSPDEARCPQDGLAFARVAGIWRFLLPDEEAHYQEFSRRYETVRQAEGWEGDDAYYRALPFADRSGRHQAIWRIRARSYRALLAHVVEPMARQRGRPLRILDLGAGNGWLSYRLAQEGHLLTAVDLLVNSFDGLGAHAHYHFARPATLLQASFDHLPLAGGEADLALFNGSIHYSTNLAQTVGEALRQLAPGGRLALLDSPWYRHSQSGARMVQERQERFLHRFGFASEALPHLAYLTPELLQEVAATCDLRWQVIKPPSGWLGWIGPLLARLWLGRETARFYLIVGRRREGA